MKVSSMEHLILILESDPDGLWESLCREYRADNVQIDHYDENSGYVILVITESDDRNYTNTVSVSEVVGIYNHYQLLLEFYSDPINYGGRAV